MNEFYLTLPSNSSMGYFPDNTLAKFTTKLPTPVLLDDNWEVGLAEIIYPTAFYNVTSDTNIFTCDVPGLPIVNAVVPPGRYDDHASLFTALRGARGIPEHFTFKLEFDKQSKRVITEIEYGHHLKFEPGLADILGYSYNSLTQVKSSAPNPMDLKATLPKALFIYSDIVEPQVVGDSSAPLLRIVGVENEQFNNTVVHTYSPPHYVSVIRRQFETIEIDIRDDTGLRIPFQSGRVIVKLHFRQALK